MAIDDNTKYMVTGAQVKDLAERIGAFSGAIVKGANAPTSSTEGTVGTLYVATSTGDLYICTAVVEESGQADTYVWAEITTKSYVDAHLGGLTLVVLTQAEYDLIDTPDPDTLYIIKAA